MTRVLEIGESKHVVELDEADRQLVMMALAQLAVHASFTTSRTSTP